MNSKTKSQTAGFIEAYWLLNRHDNHDRTVLGCYNFCLVKNKHLTLMAPFLWGLRTLSLQEFVDVYDNLNTIIQLSVFSMFHPESTYTNFFLFAEDLLPLQLLWVWKMRLIERHERHDVKIRME